MNLEKACAKIDQLSEAFQRQSLQLEQTEKMLAQYKRQLSELESVILKARNALTPRGMVKGAADLILVETLDGVEREVPRVRDKEQN